MAGGGWHSEDFFPKFYENKWLVGEDFSVWGDHNHQPVMVHSMKKCDSLLQQGWQPETWEYLRPGHMTCVELFKLRLMQKRWWSHGLFCKKLCLDDRNGWQNQVLPTSSRCYPCMVVCWFFSTIYSFVVNYFWCFPPDGFIQRKISLYLDYYFLLCLFPYLKLYP